MKIMGLSPTRGITGWKNQYFVSVAGLVPHIEAVAVKPAAALFFRNFLKDFHKNFLPFPKICTMMDIQVVESGVKW
ncbi:hypothetical protein [Enterocloster clostridioformis]|uniref:hypothetical protein n=1 Tax=Enterocloster clostridioformis TaxID=1531 RepID=UPI000405A375|nr:hypothetical protein [Enterocloster clostridioformis]